MKAISVYQPAATFIAMKWKTIETRTHARFELLEGQRIAIHAAKKDVRVPASLYDYLPAALRDSLQLSNILLSMDTNRGKIVCTAQVTKARWAVMVDFDLRKAWNEQAMCEVGGKFLLFLEEIEPINPVPFRGRQGIFNVPDELVKKLIALRPRAAQGREADSHSASNSWPRGSSAHSSLTT